MKYTCKAVLVISCMFLAVVLSVSKAFSYPDGNPPSQPPGSPPYGMAIHGDVAGTKLNGTFDIVFENLKCKDLYIANGTCGTLYYAEIAQNVHAYVQLRKGNIKKSFDLAFYDIEFKDIAGLQVTVMNAFKDMIIREFFPDQNPETMGMYLKELSEFTIDLRYAESDVPINYFYDSQANKVDWFKVISDVVVAVKPE